MHPSQASECNFILATVNELILGITMHRSEMTCSKMQFRKALILPINSKRDMLKEKRKSY